MVAKSEIVPLNRRGVLTGGSEGFLILGEILDGPKVDVAGPLRLPLVAFGYNLFRSSWQSSTADPESGRGLLMTGLPA